MNTTFAIALFLISVVMGLALKKSAKLAWIMVPCAVGAFVFAVVTRDLELRVFTWIKVFTLVLTILWINFTRFLPFGEKNFAKMGIWFILALNILEATVVDALGGFYLNSLSGLLLILFIPSWHNLHRTDTSPAQIHWPLGPAWIWAYSFWNFAFVGRFYHFHLTDHLAIVWVPVLLTTLKPEAWLQMRGYILSMYAIAIVTLEEGYGVDWPLTAMNFNDTTYHITAAAGLTLTLFHSGKTLKTIIQKREALPPNQWPAIFQIKGGHRIIGLFQKNLPKE